MKRYLLALLSVLSLSFAFAQTNFIKNQDWEAIKEQAKRENKLIFLDAYTDWCGWCKVMDKKTFSDETIGKMMNQYFVNVKLEMEKEELGIKLALKYSVTSFPSYLVFNAEGEMIYQTIGYQEQAVFMTTLMDIINPAKHHSRPGYGKSLDLEYPKFYLKAMGQNGKRKFPEEKEVNEWMDKNSDLSKEVNWTVYQRFIYAANEKNANRFWDNKAELDSLYGKDLVDNVAKNLLGTQMRTMAKDGDDSKMENTLKKRLPLIDKGEESGFYYRLFYYKETNNWKVIQNLLDNRFKEKGMDDANWWNTQAWDVYEKCDDPALIESAITWIHAVCEKDRDYNYLDTYAALLFKAGKLQEAEAKAKEAIEVGKAAGNKVEGTEKLLEKIQEALQKKETPSR